MRQPIPDLIPEAGIPRDPPGGGVLLEVRNLKTWFAVKQGLLRTTVGHVRAVDGVSFEIERGKTLGLVGESGCGKSTVGRTILKLIPATAGSVRFAGEDVFGADRRQMKALRRRMQIVFQDPVGSLNPRMTVGRIIGEPIKVHGLASGQELNDRVSSLLRRVGLSADHASRYPHEFSGGQRQRIGIARALALEPQFIVCDEPVSALDVSIQAQILNLLSDLQQELGLSYLFIAHNLAVIRHFCDRIAVMYLGKIVEIGDRDAITRNPRHPYTRALLSAAPHPSPERVSRRVVLPGEVPSPVNPPSGCVFHPRCPLARKLAGAESEGKPVAGKSLGGVVKLKVLGEETRLMEKCVKEVPALERMGSEKGHEVSCWFRDQSGGQE